MNVVKWMVRAGVVAVFAAGVVAAGTDRSDEKYGKGVILSEATSIKALYAAPEKFVGKTIRIDGVVTGVCEEMGCWMALGETANAEETVRLKVDHASNIAFPISAKGKTASAEGVFEKIADGDKESKEAASEQAASSKTMKGAEFGKKYQLKATGAVVR